MKKVVTALVVLVMATVARAALKISINGVVDPPDTQIVLSPSETAIIDMWGDGKTGPFWDGFLIAEGPGMTAGGSMIYVGTLSSLVTYQGQELADIKAWLESIGYKAVGGVSFILFCDGIPEARPLVGTLVDQIQFHCEAPGDVLLTLVNIYDDRVNPPVFAVMDTQVIHTIPEPVTFALLGLGGLFLRRRK